MGLAQCPNAGSRRTFVGLLRSGPVAATLRASFGEVSSLLCRGLFFWPVQSGWLAKQRGDKDNQTFCETKMTCPSLLVVAGHFPVRVQAHSPRTLPSVRYVMSHPEYTSKWCPLIALPAFLRRRCERMGREDGGVGHHQGG